MHQPRPAEDFGCKFVAPVTSAGPAREPPPPAKLNSKMTTSEAFAAIVGACASQIAFHAPLVRHQGEVEDVHQMRVAVRKLRAALSTFRKMMAGQRLYFEDDLRWLQDKLGAVRDWDVFRKNAVQPIEGEDSDVALVDEASAKSRAEAYRELCQALDSARCTTLWLAITRWLHSLARGRFTDDQSDQPIVKYAKREPRRRDRKLMKRGRHIAALKEDELHKLRIGAKKLRYAAEFFRDLYPKKELKRALKSMKGLQDLLGDLNDIRTCRTLLERLEPRRGLSQSVIALAHGDGLVEGAVIVRAKTRRQQLERKWRNYAKTTKPWD